jgi:alkylhydroperoxidase/carboxymuconolactone decarboxylase family protein YurZ
MSRPSDADDLPANDHTALRDELPSIQDAFPRVADSLAGYLSSLDGLAGIDRKTHELIRLACTVSLRYGPGVQRHAMLAAEFGATWDEVMGTLILTQPSFGLVPAREMLPFARAGYEAGVDALDEG